MRSLWSGALMSLDRFLLLRLGFGLTMIVFNGEQAFLVVNTSGLAIQKRCALPFLGEVLIRKLTLA